MTMTSEGLSNLTSRGSVTHALSSSSDTEVRITYSHPSAPTLSTSRSTLVQRER